jgi:hypothetical protein
LVCCVLLLILCIDQWLGFGRQRGSKHCCGMFLFHWQENQTNGGWI